MINENESALMIGSKLNPVTISDTDWSLKGQRTTDDMSTVSVGVPVILFSRDFSQTNYHLNWGFPQVFFHRLFYPFSEHQLGKNNFHLR